MVLRTPHGIHYTSDPRFRRNYDIYRDSYQALDMLRQMEVSHLLLQTITHNLAHEQKIAIHTYMQNIDKLNDTTIDMTADIAIEHIWFDKLVHDNADVDSMRERAEASAQNFLKVLNEKTEQQLGIPKWQYVLRLINEIIQDAQRADANRFLKPEAYIVETLSVGENADDKQVTAQSVFDRLKTLIAPTEGPVS